MATTVQSVGEGAAPAPDGRRWLIYGLLFALTAISYIDRASLSVAAPLIAKAFGATPVAMGYLFSSFLWTYLICLIPVGLMVDRFGAGKTAAGGITLWCLATIGTGLAGGYGAMLAARLALGAGESTVYPAGVRVVREWAPTRERGIASGLLNAGSYAGPAFGALLTGWLVAAFGWRTAFIVTGAAGLLWLVPWLLWYRPRAPDLDAGADGSPASSLGALLRRRCIWGMALTQGCAVYSQYLFLTWLPSYLQSEKGLDVQNAGLFTAIPYAASVVLSLIVCHLSDRLVQGRTEAGGRRGVVAVMLLASSVVLAAPLVQSVWLITLLITLSLTGISSAISLNFALAGDLVRASGDIGKAAGIMVFGGNAFGLAAPIVTGYVIAGTGSYNWAFVIAGVLLIGGATAVMTLTPARR